MTQADFTIANQTFPNTRTELNTSLQALATNSAGNSAPSTTFPNQWWFDSDGNTLYMRNKDNDAWVTVLTIGATSDDVESLTANVIAEGTSATGVTIDGLLVKDGAVGVAGTATSVAGIPFFSDVTNGSIYTHDVSGTDSTAQNNTAYGLTALDAITTGDDNVAIGFNAGGTMTTGLENVIIGSDAVGTGVMTAGQGVFIGNDAGLNKTSGSSCIFIGYQAGEQVTTGGSSIFIGRNAGDDHDTENNNLGIGQDALGGSIAGGEYNVAIGNFSLDALTSADYNTAIGYNAGTAITTGAKNTILGAEAGEALVSTPLNVIIGYAAAKEATTAAYNVIVGAEAVTTGILTGNNNAIMGYESGKVMTSGANNTLLGFRTGLAITSGSENTIIGKDAGSAMVDQKLTAVGYQAGQNTTANQCNFFGYTAGKANTSGQDNIAMGYAAYDQADTENHNLAIGNAAMGGAVAGGEYNVAIGNNTLDALTSGDDNTVVGYQAGSAVTTGYRNTFIGSLCGDLTDDGFQNVAMGYGALSANCGDNNVAIGESALPVCTGAGNTAVGRVAGLEVTSGGNNLFLGKDAGRSSSPSGSVTTGSNIICLGDDNIANLFCADTSISSSDKRDKTDIENFTTGLSFIEKMQPVTYKWDKRSWYSDDLLTTPDGSKKATKTNVGFLAQDVEALEKEIGFANDKDDMLFANLTDDGQRYGMKYERLVTVLVNAVKELSAEIKALKGE